MVGSVDRLFVRGQLAIVSATLRRRGTSRLSAAQLARRRWAIEELDHYWKACALPRNTYVSGKSPVFVDENGRRCAVAHLLSRSGHESVVEEIRSGQNLARIGEMNSHAVAVWADDHGLTIDELAEIQPAYSLGPDRGLTIWMIVIGAAAFLTGIRGIGAFVKGSYALKRIRESTVVSVFLATLASIVVLRFNPPCEGICFVHVRPPFALPLLVVLWMGSFGLVALWFIARRNGRSRRHAQRRGESG